MIISRTPFRISFIGGGSDLQSYYKYKGGAVISSTINKYIYQTAHEYFKKEYSLVKYSKTEIVNSINNINHPIIKNIFKRFDIKQIDYNSTADIPSGTGMGSSSSFTVGLINLCSKINNLNLSKMELANIACEVEINDLGEPIGKQDQFAASYGGFNRINFLANDHVEVNKINLDNLTIDKLNRSFQLFYTGTQRSASTVLKEQKNKMIDKNKREVLDEMVSLVPIFNDKLITGKLNDLGRILDENWKLKRSITNKISSSEIDDLYKKGLKCGASGGKLLGAGGGGFILFYVPINNLEYFNRKFNFLDKYSFNFEFNGSQIIYNDEK